MAAAEYGGAIHHNAKALHLHAQYKGLFGWRISYTSGSGGNIDTIPNKGLRGYSTGEELLYTFSKDKEIEKVVINGLAAKVIHVDHYDFSLWYLIGNYEDKDISISAYDISGNLIE